MNQYQTDSIIYGTIPKVIEEQKSKVEDENEEVQKTETGLIKTKSKSWKSVLIKTDSKKLETSFNQNKVQKHSEMNKNNIRKRKTIKYIKKKKEGIVPWTKQFKRRHQIKIFECRLSHALFYSSSDNSCHGFSISVSVGSQPLFGLSVSIFIASGFPSGPGFSLSS